MTRFTIPPKRSHSLRLSLAVCVATLSVPWGASAQVVTTDDTAGMGGMITVQSTGNGSGFMGQLGVNGGTPIGLLADSDILGKVQFDLVGAQCMGGNDVSVIYIDSIPGVGIASTTPLTGPMMPTLRQAAVSGVGTMGGQSNIDFPLGFRPDFAIAFQNFGTAGMTAELFALTAPAPISVLSLAVSYPSPPALGCAAMRLTGLTMASIGLTPGDAFSWMGTLLNASNAFRSNEFQGTPAPAMNIGILGPLVAYALPPGRMNRFLSVQGPIVINEVDTDTPGTDRAEFIELLGPPNLRLDGLALVTYNGSDDRSYNLGGHPNAVDLDGQTTDGAGFFLVGNAAVAGVDISFSNNGLQNGADAVALYVGDGAAFPNDTAITTIQLVDAIVYDTNDGDDMTLLALLEPSEPQLNEDGAGNKDMHSNSRCPDGGEYRVTSNHLQVPPTPGASNACPAIAVCGNGMLEAGEDCDDGGSNGMPTSCCAMDCSFRASGETCAASLGGCDAPNTCDGAGTCDVNVASAGTECRADSMAGCDVAEVCDGTSAACPVDGFASAAVECRAAAGGLCDVAENCTGSSAVCPADGFVSAGTECRAAVPGGCDLAEACSGSSAACPADLSAAAGTVCRAASVNGCDVAEVCDGSATCPADGFASAGTICRAAPGDCDVAETCTGSTDRCPVDVFVSGGTVCRPTNGSCDVQEACTGMDAACPSDGFRAAGTVCNVSTGVCDPAESCTGSSNSCPANMFSADGTSCADGVVCDGTEICAAGICVDGTALSCDDSNLCTADMCAEPGGCDNAAIADCCNIDDDCDDSDICTADSCDGPGGTCTTSTITDCCISDDDCDDANMCTGDSCNLTTNRCERTPIAGCCAVDGDCSDGNACTADICDATSGECTNVAIDGCCLAAGDCDDDNTCTADTCSDAMMCVNEMMAGCCLTADDCDDMDPCTTDSCDGTAACVHEMIAGCGDMDAGVSDAGMGDAGMDAGPADAGADAGVGDGGMDAATDDGGTADGGDEDAGESGGVGGGACGCKLAGDTSGTTNPLWLLGIAALVFVRRRRR